MRRLLLALLFLPALSFAQAPAPTSTTLTQALTGPSPQTGASTIMGNTVFLASRTGVIGPIVPGTTAVLLYVDREAMAVQSVNPNTGGITVERGYLGTQPTAHNSGATVLYGRTDIAAQTVFYTFDPAGACVSGNAPNPWINVLNANQWTCTGGVWVVSSAIYSTGSGLPAGPTTPNSRAQVITSTPTGGVAGVATYGLPGDIPTDRGSGEASYTFLATDIGTTVRETNVAGEVFTIPDGNVGAFILPVNIGIIVQGGASTLARQTSSQIRCTPNGVLANSCPLTLGAQYILKETSDFNYTLSASGDATSSALSSISAATGSATIANGNNPIIWNWTITTDAQDGLAFGETAAATNGTITNGLANQAILSTSTATNSTATPLEVAQGSITNTVATPAAQIESTWNNASLVGKGLRVVVNNTSSSGSSCTLEVDAGASGNVQDLCLGPTGVLNLIGSFQTQATSGSFAGAGSNTPIVFQGGQDASLGAATGTGTFKGADNSSNNSAAAAGLAIFRAGELTNAAPNAAALEGVVQVGSGFLKGSAVANIGDVVCGTTTAFTVTDCAITPQVNIVGIATSTSNPIGVVSDGQALVKTDGAVTIGDTICMGTTTAGLAHDSGGQGACATAGTSIGVVIADSGTITTMNGASTASTAMSTTLPLVQLHIGK